MFNFVQVFTNGFLIISSRATFIDIASYQLIITLIFKIHAKSEGLCLEIKFDESSLKDCFSPEEMENNHATAMADLTEHVVTMLLLCEIQPLIVDMRKETCIIQIKKVKTATSTASLIQRKKVGYKRSTKVDKTLIDNAGHKHTHWYNPEYDVVFKTVFQD